MSGEFEQQQFWWMCLNNYGLNQWIKKNWIPLWVGSVYIFKSQYGLAWSFVLGTECDSC